MTQLGEPVDPQEFLGDSPHSEDTCPWHQKAEPKTGQLEAESPNTDEEGIPENMGGVLKANLMARASEDPWAYGLPDADSVELEFRQHGRLRYRRVARNRRTKRVETRYPTVQVYQHAADARAYALEYAPHHLIPGNASLKGSAIVPYLGDDGSISLYAEGMASKIDKGFTGYDVNAAENGVFLPSPYALTHSNSEWPSLQGTAKIAKRLGDNAAATAYEFRAEYAAASIEVSGGRQFHNAHQEYSDNVRDVLDAIAKRLKGMPVHCLIVKPEGEPVPKKFPPPYGLVGRLNAVSANLRRMVAGPVWRTGMLTSSLNDDYLADRAIGKTSGLRSDVDPVL